MQKKIMFQGGSIALEGDFLKVSIKKQEFEIGPLEDEVELRNWLSCLIEEEVPKEEQVDVLLKAQRLLLQGHVFQPKLISFSGNSLTTQSTH